MSFYVRRSATRTDLITQEVTERSGWIGPIDSASWSS